MRPTSRVWLSAITLGGLLAACQHRPDGPTPHCSIPATVQRFVTRDSCRGFVLALNQAGSAPLQPTGQLWQAFLPQARNGQQVFIEYVTATESDVPGCRAPLSRAVRLTCLTTDAPPDTPKAPRDTTKTKP